VAYYLGIDGGGSKTSCAVGDEVSLLATVSAGPSNITRVGEARTRESLHKAIRDACAAAKISPQQVECACIGVAGAGREEIAVSVRKITAEAIPGKIEVVGDMQIASEAAFGEGPGVIVIAGTGSIAYGRDRQGRAARAGGWGFAISDEGSAHWIGRAVVKHLLRAVDETGIQKNGSQAPAKGLSLLHRLHAAWDLHSLDAFVRTANSNPDFAALFPTVVAAADDGDTLAQCVLEQSGRELAQLAAIIVRQLFPENKAGTDIPLAMAGGVFRHAASVRKVFCDEILTLDPRFKVRPQVVEPVMGALQMARVAGRRK
jgi:glucosamine kinase